MADQITIFNIGTGHTKDEPQSLLVQLWQATNAIDVPVGRQRSSKTKVSEVETLDEQDLKIASHTKFAKMIVDGVGGHGHAAQATGWGMNDKTALAVHAATATRAQRVNLVGHSRGAILCFRIANELQRKSPGVQVRILAVDPVAQTMVGKREDRSTLGSNVTKFTGIVMRDDNMPNMFPLTLPTSAGTRAGLGPEAYIDLCGTHGTATLVGWPIGNTALEIGKRFLRDCLVPLSSPPHSDLWLVNEYCKIRSANPVVPSSDGAERVINDLKQEQVKWKRVLLSDTLKRKAQLIKAGLTLMYDPSKPFINAHHAAVFRAELPATWAVLSARPEYRAETIDRYETQFDREWQRLKGTNYSGIRATVIAALVGPLIA